jgi:hypothetical protein
VSTTTRRGRLLSSVGSSGWAGNARSRQRSHRLPTVAVLLQRLAADEEGQDILRRLRAVMEEAEARVNAIAVEAKGA